MQTGNHPATAKAAGLADLSNPNALFGLTADEIAAICNCPNVDPALNCFGIEPPPPPTPEPEDDSVPAGIITTSAATAALPFTGTNNPGVFLLIGGSLFAIGSAAQLTRRRKNGKTA